MSTTSVLLSLPVKNGLVSKDSFSNDVIFLVSLIGHTTLLGVNRVTVEIWTELAWEVGDEAH